MSDLPIQTNLQLVLYTMAAMALGDTNYLVALIIFILFVLAVHFQEAIIDTAISDQRQILSWCASLEEAKLNGEFEHKPTDSYFLKQVKTICQLATMDLKE